MKPSFGVPIVALATMACAVVVVYAKPRGISPDDVSCIGTTHFAVTARISETLVGEFQNKSAGNGEPQVDPNAHVQGLMQLATFDTARAVRSLCFKYEEFLEFHRVNMREEKSFPKKAAKMWMSVIKANLESKQDAACDPLTCYCVSGEVCAPQCSQNASVWDFDNFRETTKLTKLMECCSETPCSSGDGGDGDGGDGGVVYDDEVPRNQSTCFSFAHYHAVVVEQARLIVEYQESNTTFPDDYVEIDSMLHVNAFAAFSFADPLRPVPSICFDYDTFYAYFHANMKFNESTPTDVSLLWLASMRTGLDSNNDACDATTCYCVGGRTCSLTCAEPQRWNGLNSSDLSSLTSLNACCDASPCVPPPSGGGSGGNGSGTVDDEVFPRGQTTCLAAAHFQSVGMEQTALILEYQQSNTTFPADYVVIDPHLHVNHFASFSSMDATGVVPMICFDYDAFFEYHFDNIKYSPNIPTEVGLLWLSTMRMGLPSNNIGCDPLSCYCVDHRSCSASCAANTVWHGLHFTDLLSALSLHDCCDASPCGTAPPPPSNATFVSVDYTVGTDGIARDPTVPSGDVTCVGYSQFKAVTYEQNKLIEEYQRHNPEERFGAAYEKISLDVHVNELTKLAFLTGGGRVVKSICFSYDDFFVYFVNNMHDSVNIPNQVKELWISTMRNNLASKNAGCDVNSCFCVDGKACSVTCAESNLWLSATVSDLLSLDSLSACCANSPCPESI